MRDAIISVRTVAALGWVGTNLAFSARTAIRRRSRTVDLLRGVRLRHVWPAPLVLTAVVAVFAVLSFALTACGGATGLQVTSPDIREGRPLPERFTCTGANEVPTLSWTSGPPDTRGWAVVVEDPDAPTGTFTHWVVTGLGAPARMVSGELPVGAVEGLTSSGQRAYVGPCPPTGEEHRFRYRVHALRELLVLEPATSVAESRRRIESLSLAAAEIEVTYQTP